MLVVTQRKYIHYGSDAFYPDRWCDINNMGYRNKPGGGLWASPVDSEYSWYEWCKDASYELQALERSFVFSLTPDARILEITPENVWSLPKTDPKGLYNELFAETDPNEYGIRWGIDFEALSRDYDVLECSLSRYPQLYWNLYGWDCDCILVLNKEVIRYGEKL